MDPSPAAELKAVLAGVDLPAEKASLLEYAVHRRAEPALLEALQALPPRRYESLDEVTEQLLRVEPERNDGAGPPREESGPPPGGDDYTR